MRCILTFLAIAVAAVSAAAEPPLSFQSEGDGIYVFETGTLRGRLRLNGHNQGISELIHVPTGQEVTYGGRKLPVMSHYRLFTTGARYGHAARTWPTECKLLPDGAVEAQFKPDEDYPFTMRAVFRLGAPDAIDVETIVTAKEDLPRFEVFLSNYFGEGYDASVYVIHSLRSPGKPYLLRADHNPLVAGNYLLFPRDRESVLDVFDGRWQQPPNPVEWCITRYLAAPVGVRRHKETGLTALVMAPREDCFAVSTPYNQDPPDGVANHRSLYLSLFGGDVAKGDTVCARSRLQILVSPTDEAIQKCYEAYDEGIVEQSVTE
jgi:hypothetical protein